MSDKMDGDEDMGDEDMGDEDMGADGGGADAAASPGAAGPSAPGPVPIVGYPSLLAGDFANGHGVLGMARTAGDVGGSSIRGPNPAVPSQMDAYRWMQNLGDQGIAYQVNGGKLSVFETPGPGDARGPGPYGVVGIDDYVPGQTNDQPTSWRQYPPRAQASQDLGLAVPQDLNAIQQVDRYLFRDPRSASLGQFVQNAQVPTITIPDAQDRFEPFDGSRGVIYWNPQLGLQTADGLSSGASSTTPGSMSVQSPALGLGHERNHAFDWIDDPVGYLLDALTPTGDDYDNWEEKRTIDNVETPAARLLGEPTRSNHRGNDVLVPQPTSHTRVKAGK